MEIPAGQLIQVGQLWDGATVQPDVLVWVDAAGIIRAMGRGTLGGASGAPAELVPLAGGAPVHLPDGLSPLSLRDRLVFPGFVNTHSHAFQRLIRGRTLTVPAADPSADFWSWRAGMYSAANRLNPEQFEAVTAFCYGEMLKAGITQVVEFHYVHHQPGGQPYGDRNELSRRVLRAARNVGIRVLLLPVAYHQGGFSRPALLEQQRFLSPDLHTYLEQVDALVEDAHSSPLTHLGLAAHSVRAVPVEWLNPLKQAADARAWMLHIHVSEQQAEINQCLAATRVRPVELLERVGFLGPRTTLVHATWLSEAELDLIAQRQASVSLCPSTEQDLGDGLGEAAALLERGVEVHLGSDSHVLLDFFEEMRLLEGHERLKRLKRNVLARAREGALRVLTPTLWHAATRAGARAIGRDTGRLEVGCPWDAFTIALDAPQWDGLAPKEIPAALICAGNASMVKEVFVGGRLCAAEGSYEGEAQVRVAYRRIPAD